MITIKNKYLAIIGTMLLSTSCSDFLDKSPLSSVTEEIYFSNDKQLESYVYDRYPNLLNHKNAGGYSTMIACDANTDDKVDDNNAVPLYVKGAAGLKVADQGGLWNFNNIRKCNYFFDKVLPLKEAGKISGSEKLINHAIGEMYFFRAYEYYDKYRELGDMPICTTVPTLEYEKLSQESARQPRTEVARFILSDLDKAIELLQEKAPDGRKNRLNKAAAYLMKSRVALFEGTWLQNFKGTAFVPNGPQWTGAKVHAGYKFKAGSIEEESKWFLGQAMEAAKVVADNHSLTPQNADFSLQKDAGFPVNPYYDMFSAKDLSDFEEVLVWRDYSLGLNVTHGAAVGCGTGNNNYGTTKGFVESFLMSNGLPIYANNSGYKGDNSLVKLAEGRDARLSVFLKYPGQLNKIYNKGLNSANPLEEPKVPTLFHASFAYTTGYTIRKFGNRDGAQFGVGLSDYGCPLFRAAEAYLNYIEACYEKNGSLDAKASEYWKALRKRSNVNLANDGAYEVTINNTDMNIEAKGDWGAYTAGQLVDATRYNIRRERRNELMSEGFRMTDLRRWRSMDQMMSKPYIIQGFKLWNSDMTAGYGNILIECGKPKANVSAKSDGDYLCPHRIVANHDNFDGYRWVMAHYLTPIAAKHFTMTGGEQSTIYQNPGWGITAGSNAE